MKKIGIALVILIFGFGAWYLVSPFFIDTEIIEELPAEFLLNTESAPAKKIVTNDNTELVFKKENNEKIEVLEDTVKEVHEEKKVTEKKIEVKANTPTETAVGNFEKVDYEVTGGFSLLQNNEKSLLRINSLNITNGPDLYLVLSNQKPAFGNKDFTIISELKANKGSFNVSVPEEIVFSDYKYLLIHCKQFNHTFAAAEIQNL